MKQIIKIVSLCGLFIAPSVIGMQENALPNATTPIQFSKVSLVAKAICNRRAALTTLASIAVGVAIYFTAKHHRGLCASIAATVPIVIGMIIQKKRATKATDELKKSMFDIVLNNNIEHLQRLLDQGADLEVHDNVKDTILAKALGYGKMILAKLLLEHGANINNNTCHTGDTYLIHAVYINKLNIVNFLLNNGADINLKNYRGATALDIAKKLDNRQDIVNALQRRQEQ